MSIEINKNNQSYSYTMGCGPVRFKCHSSYSKDLKRIDRLMECLNEPNVEAATFFGQVGRQARDVRVILVRLINYLKTGTWMNEEGARKLVKHYTRMDAAKKSPEQTRKLQQVYDRLAQIKREDGTYASNIERGALEPQPAASNDAVKMTPQRLFSMLIEDPRMQEATKLVGSLAVEVLALVVKSYGCEVASRTAAAALAPLRASKAPVASRVMTV